MYEHHNTLLSSNSVTRVTVPYTSKMTRIWELAKTILCFSVIFVGLGGATPPYSTATLSAWTACRKMVDTAENEPKLADFDSSKAWSAVVILRKDGRVIGVGDSHEKDPIQRAIGTAIADAKRRIGQAGGDAAAVPWSQMTLELEVGSKPEPLIGSTYLQAAQEVEPALDGIAVRRGTVWAVAHPAVLQSLNAAAAPDQTFLSLVMQLGLPARDFDEIPATERVALYKFDTTRIVQPALTMLPPKCCAASHGAPARSWRRTITWLRSASRVRTVSISDSPLPTDEVATLKVVTRAPSAAAATSNEMRVRVEGS